MYVHTDKNVPLVDEKDFLSIPSHLFIIFLLKLKKAFHCGFTVCKASLEQTNLLG